MKPIFVICLVPFVAWTLEAGESAAGWTNLLSEGKALTWAGNYSAAAQAFRQALTAAEGANAGERSLVEIHDALASVYAEAGRYAESEHEYRRALALTEKSQGRRSLDYALLVASMAMLPTQMGNREAVAPLLGEAIIANRESGRNRELAIVRVCLAQILLDAKRYAEAESVLLEAQGDLAALKTENPKLVAELLNELGLLRFEQRRYKESAELDSEALQMFQDVMGDAHPALIGPLNNLALSYLKLGRLNEAELKLNRAMGICSRTLGEDHATYGALLESYAVVLRKLDRKHEAKAVSTRSQQITRAYQRRNGVGATISVAALRSARN
jgi:tetratricopeptide (TPR) repeat protein